LSIKELKSLLAEHSVDCSACVEKAELRQLWDRFASLKIKPLEELKASSALLNGRGLPGWQGASSNRVAGLRSCWLPKKAKARSSSSSPAVKASKKKRFDPAEGRAVGYEA